MGFQYDDDEFESEDERRMAELEASARWEARIREESECRHKQELEWAMRHPNEWFAWVDIRAAVWPSFAREYGFAEFLADLGQRPPGHEVGRKDKAQPFVEGNLCWVPMGGSPADPPPAAGGPYTTEEFGRLVDRKAWTIRRLCSMNIIQAERDDEAGRTGEWRIPFSEYQRWHREGPFKLPR